MLKGVVTSISTAIVLLLSSVFFDAPLRQGLQPPTATRPGYVARSLSVLTPRDHASAASTRGHFGDRAHFRWHRRRMRSIWVAGASCAARARLGGLYLPPQASCIKPVAAASHLRPFQGHPGHSGAWHEPLMTLRWQFWNKPYYEGNLEAIARVYSPWFPNVRA